jgi:hypothetical protein
VPDLEAIATIYLDILAAMERGEPGREADYDWILLELYDQTVRQVSGGRMRPWLERDDLPNRPFIRSRIGEEADRCWQKSRGRGIFGHAQHRGWRSVLFVAWQRLSFRRALARVLVRILAGRDAAQAFDEGWYRRSGEIHRWMYDRFSLRRLLGSAGFSQVRVVQPQDSAISGFANFQLDCNEQGEARKPDSIYVEAVRPITGFAT